MNERELDRAKRAEPREGGLDFTQLGFGVVLLVVGFAVLAERRGWVDFGTKLGWWPLILVGFGAVAVATHETGRRLRSGLWLVLLGGWLLTNTVGLLGFHWGNSWPLLIIGSGLIDLGVPRGARSRWEGLAPVAIGSWLLVNTRQLFGMDWTSSWPILLLVIGALVVARGLGLREGRRERRGGER